LCVGVGTRTVHLVLGQGGPRLPQGHNGASLRGSNRASWQAACGMHVLVRLMLERAKTCLAYDLRLESVVED